MKLIRAIAMATLSCGLLATPAFADITGFIGANTTPANRQVRGVAAGIGPAPDDSGARAADV